MPASGSALYGSKSGTRCVNDGRTCRPKNGRLFGASLASATVRYKTVPSVRALILEDRFARLLDSAGCIPQNHRTQ